MPLIIALFIGAAAVSSSVAQSPRHTGVSQSRVVTIITQPDSSIRIDGVLFGKTDAAGRLEIKTIPSGGHIINIRAFGYAEATRQITSIQKGEVKVILVKTTDEAEIAFQNAEKLSSVDRDKAIAAYRSAIKLRPGYVDASIALARSLSEAGDLEEAEKTVLMIRRSHPALAEASAVEGRILKDGGDEAKSIVAFKRAVTEGKGFQPEALTGLGLIYKERAEGFGGSGDFEQEKASYDESAKYFALAVKQLSGAPDSLVVYQLLGLIYEREQRFDEAIAIYEEFLRLFPASTEASAVRSFIEQIRKQRTERP
jgi:tetratricopeptide (TPR) repeat protein